jgi:hypothetical protein
MMEQRNRISHREWIAGPLVVGEDLMSIRIGRADVVVKSN